MKPAVEQPIIEEIKQYFEISQWGQPCRAMFDSLVQNDPGLPLKITSSHVLEPALLTYAAEALGKAAGKLPEKEYLDVIVPLLNHPSALVGEGAVYGLEPLVDHPEVLSILTERLVTEQSPGVREAIIETIEG